VNTTVFAAYPTFGDRAFVNVTGLDGDDDCVTTGAGRITSNNGEICGNYIENVNQAGAALATYGNQADGINLFDGFGRKIHRNVIKNTSEGIDNFGNEDDISANTIEDCTEFGVKLTHGASYNKVRHNDIRRCGIGGIALVGGEPTYGDTEWNIVESNNILSIDPDDLHSGDETACIRLSNNLVAAPTGGAAKNNRLSSNNCDPGAFGEYSIANNSAGDVNNAYERNAFIAAGVLGDYLVLAANNFTITPRIATKAQATRNAVQSIPNGGVATKVTLNTVVIDTLTELDVVTNNRWVCKHPGYYFVDFQVGMALCRGLYTHVYKNGAAIISVPEIDSATDVVQSGYARVLVYMSVGDYLEGWVQHTSAAARNLLAGAANTSFTVTPAL
jgi:hypothetical protein